MTLAYPLAYPLAGALARALAAARHGGSSDPIPGLGDLNDGYYHNWTLGTFVPERGPTFSNTRAAPTFPTTTVDFEGLVRNIQANEGRWKGLRRVENTLAGSNVAAGGWAIPSGTDNGLIAGVGPNGEDARQYTTVANVAQITRASYHTINVSRTFTATALVRLVPGSTAITITGFGGNGIGSTSIALTTAWRILSHTQTGISNFEQLNFIVSGTTGGQFQIVWAQYEETTGQGITTFGGYVSKGVLSAPYHGAGVDGVKNFTTANGNTVASNVVTEAAGTALPVNTPGTLAGINPFGAHTNVVLWNRDLTNAAWVASNVTVAKTATGADGAANSASTLTATAGNGTVLQAITLASSARSQETMVKRRTGSGVINMTTDNGSTWTAITVTAGWTKVRIPLQTLANPTVGFRIVTSGDAIDVDYVMNTAVVDAPLIATTTATVAVNADVVTANGTGVINQTEGTLYVEAVGPANSATGFSEIFMLHGGSANEAIRIEQNAGTALLYVIDGGVQQTGVTRSGFVAGVVAKLAGRYKLNNSNLAQDGSAGTADTACTMPTTTTLQLGYIDPGYEPNTTIRVTALSRTGVNDAGLAQATAP